MKTALDPRHLKREEALKALFQYSYSKSVENDSLAKKIIEQKDALDEIIVKAAPEWPIEKLNRVDLAILRLAIFETLEGKTPIKVIVDEAIELAKTYGSDGSPRFINGALGAALKLVSGN